MTSLSTTLLGAVAALCCSQLSPAEATECPAFVPDKSWFTTTPDSSLPAADDADPIHLVLLSGQSEAAGAGKAADLAADAGSYPQLAGAQDGVWFGGQKGSSEVFIAPLEAGQSQTGERFGPEVALGQRIREATGARVMVVKYAWEGTNVYENWNPDTETNRWDYDQDDGTAAWLKANSCQDFKNENALFVNQVYTARRVTEELDAAGVAYEWKAFFWMQGASDGSLSNNPSVSTWQNFGAATARVFDSVRQRTVGTWDLPIIDNGANGKPNRATAKRYAAQIVKGCNVRTVEVNIAVPDPADPENKNLINPTLYNHFGWDPMIEENDPIAVGLRTTDEEFAWYVDFPGGNMHSAYEGCILNGRMLANEYIREFTDSELTEAMKDDDVTLLAPMVRCAVGQVATQDAMCWTDERTGDQRDAECVPDDSDNDAGPSPPACVPNADSLWTGEYVRYNPADTTTDCSYRGPYKAFGSATALRQHLHFRSAVDASKWPAPVYFFAHGDGGKSPNMGGEDLDTLAGAGYAVIDWESFTKFSGNLPDSAPLEKQLETAQIIRDDFALVIEWAVANADRYGFDVDRFVIGGRSRGSLASWPIAQSQSDKYTVSGIYMFNALPLPDEIWQGPSSPLVDVTSNAPPTHFLYAPACPTTPPQATCDVATDLGGDIHSPWNGQRVVEAYEALGIGAKITLTQGCDCAVKTLSSPLGILHDFPDFAASLASDDPSPPCTDDDAGLIALAATQNQDVPGCSVVQARREACEFSQVASLCCESCVAIGLGAANVQVMRSTNPFVADADLDNENDNDANDEDNTKDGDANDGAAILAASAAVTIAVAAAAFL